MYLRQDGDTQRKPSEPDKAAEERNAEDPRFTHPSLYRAAVGPSLLLSSPRDPKLCLAHQRCWSPMGLCREGLCLELEVSQRGHLCTSPKGGTPILT